MRVLISNLVFCLTLSCLACAEIATDVRIEASYPNFYDNSLLDDEMRSLIAPYLLPETHPLKCVVDHLFSQSRATETMESLVLAGFQIIAAMQNSYIVVAKHSAVPGYVFKIYLDTERRSRDNKPNWRWLINRCYSARMIRLKIAQKKIEHFVVPDKWIYLLPQFPASRTSHPAPFILMETDMDIESAQISKNAWKKEVSRSHLNELYAILRHGYGSVNLGNIPRTKNGKFAFIDTEFSRRRHNLKHVKKYLSNEMAHYWEHLIK
ncbi:MAG: hypothetical protein K2P51_03450 [Rhabdochlamydiaceae bacterium]|nr:hypothetical protein [Rhabdochlamydiaceae bacterium]